MKRSVPFLLLLALFLVASFAQPAFSIYQWVDDKGLLHITDYPPPSKEPAPKPEPAKPAAPATAPTASVAPAASAAPALPKTVPSMTAAATKPSATATEPSVTAVVAPAPAPAAAPSSEMPASPRQHMPLSPAGIKALAGGFLMIFALIALAFYIYYSYSMYLIAKKLGVAEAWMSWVPILNLWPFLTSAGKPCWWVILLFIPFVNIIVIVYLWMCICENLGRNKWLGLLVLVPVANLILPGVLAFSNNE